MEGFSISEARVYSGFEKPWMVDYLCRTGIIVPGKRKMPGRGRPRLFTFADLVMLRTINQLLKRGVSVKRLSLQIRRYRKRFGEITQESNPFRFIVADGTRLYFLDKTQQVLSLDKPGQYCFRFVIDVEQAHRDVVATIDANPQIPTTKSFRKSQTAA